MKLVKEILSDTYKIISDTAYNVNPNLYHDRNGSPIYWNLYGYELGDAILVKDTVKAIYDASGWTSFKGVDEKITVAKILAYSLPQVELDEVLTLGEQDAAKLFYVEQSKICRGIRWEYLRQQLALHVTESQSLGFYSDTEQFKGKYIDAGLPHLLLWLTNGAYAPLGIDYTNAGFAETSYYTTEMLQMCIDYLSIGEQFVT